MNEELNYDERRDWAKTLYTRQDHDIRETALTVAVDEATVRMWVKEGEWDGIKTSLLISKTAQIKRYYDLLRDLDQKSGNEFNLKHADLSIKYTAAIENLSGGATVCDILDVFEPFIKWMRRKDLPFTKKLILHCDAFVKQQLTA